MESKIEHRPTDTHARGRCADCSSESQRFQWELGCLNASPVHQMVIQPDRVIAERVSVPRFPYHCVGTELRVQLDSELHAGNSLCDSALRDCLYGRWVQFVLVRAP